MLLFWQLRHRLAKTKLRAPLLWVRHRSVLPSDVFVASYPRSGSTWLIFLLVEILTGQSPQFGFAHRIVPYVGKQRKAPRLLPRAGRLIRTHETYRAAYKRAIYLVRDVRDVLVSECLYWRWRNISSDESDDFLAQFLKGRANQFGSWPDHVNSWLDAASQKKVDIIVLKYEDMRRNTEDVLMEVLSFLKVDADQGRIREAIQNNSIEEMKQKEERARQTVFKTRPRDVPFVHEGSVGGWRQKLTDAQVRLVEGYAGDSLIRTGYLLMNTGAGGHP